MTKLPDGRLSDATVSDPFPGVGRPTLASPAIKNRILDLISDGKTLTEVCQASDMPHRTTVYGWMREDDAFFNAYRTRAKPMQADAIAEKALIDARTAEDAQLGMLAFRAATWFAAKMDHRYSDRAQVDMQTLGADGKPADPAPFVVQFVGAKDGKPE